MVNTYVTDSSQTTFLEKDAEEDPDTPRYGSLALDRAELTVKNITSGVVVRLTPKEFDLLALLVSKSGRMVSKNEIYQELYASQNKTRGNSIVKVHICKLRQKLLDGFGSRVIRTVRGKGYSVQQVL